MCRLKISLQIIIHYSEKSSNFPVEVPGRHRLEHVTEVSILSGKKTDFTFQLVRCDEKDTHLLGFFRKKKKKKKILSLCLCVRNHQMDPDDVLAPDQFSEVPRSWQGETEEPSRLGGDDGSLATRCTVGSWVGSWARRRTPVKRAGTLVRAGASLMLLRWC